MSTFKVYHNQNFLDYSFTADKVDSLSDEFLFWVADVECANIDKAFELTNHIDDMWWNNKEVQIICDDTPKYRSTSVGDVIYDEAAGKYFMCAGIGWKEITLV